MQKNVLITNFEMRQFTGSEINAATIAKRFKELGYKVYMLAMYFDEPLYSEIKDCFDVIIDTKKNDFDFSNIEFDILWVHHSFLLNWLIFEYNIKAKKIIVSSLSGIVNFEFVPQYANELSLVLANSEETKDALIKEGIKEVYVLENYSFKKYFQEKNEVNSLRNIAIVSNHVPEEVMQAKEMLEKAGYNVEIYGMQGIKTLINDEILKKYDTIISIGKTVQYAMSLQIPVYVYDIHGGEGYLTLDNLEKNRTKNFSGRGFNKKNSELIYKEIVEEFEKALKITPEIKKYAYDNFCFENNIDKILEIIESKPEVDLVTIRDKTQNKREMLISKGMAQYLIEKYEDILRIERHNLYTEIKRLSNNEEELRTMVVEKDNLIQKQGEVINQQELAIKRQEELIREYKNSISGKFYRAWRRIVNGRRNKNK